MDVALTGQDWNLADTEAERLYDETGRTHSVYALAQDIAKKRLAAGQAHQTHKDR